MEDSGRELEPDPLNTHPVKDGYQSSKKLTIMLIGSVGKMRSFKISRKIILYTSIFFFIYVALSLLVFYLYFDLYSAHKAQSNQLKDLETELSEKIKTMEKDRLYTEGLEEFYNTAQKGMDEKSDTTIAQKKSPEPGKPKKNVSNKAKSKDSARKGVEKKTDAGITRKKATEPSSPKVNVPREEKKNEVVQEAVKEKADTGASPQKAPEVNVTSEEKSKEIVQEAVKEKIDTGAAPQKTPEPGSPEIKSPDETESRDTALKEDVKDTMEVKDISFQRTDSELTLNFILKNELAEHNTAEGYIHIIVMDKNKECPLGWNSTYNKLSGGFPVNFRHGQQFSIKNLRPYQRKYKTNPDSELPSFIRIIVYDRSGQKILEKEFPVTDESANDAS